MSAKDEEFTHGFAGVFSKQKTFSYLSSSLMLK